ncbi:MAG: coproporphyrinogen-III oxidase family protein [Thermoanaerobaculia bacterium]
MLTADDGASGSFLERLPALADSPSLLMEAAALRLDALPIARLRSCGFDKAASNYAYVYQYPPPGLLEPIQAGAIRSQPLTTVSPAREHKFGLYVHVPFCTGTCLFCYFARHEHRHSPVSMTEYIALLRRELALVADHSGLNHAQITTVAFGGGTPTCLTQTQIADIFSALHDTFVLPDGIESSFEASPETITAASSSKLRILRDCQVNRLSIGVQSFDDALLRRMGRRHDAHTALCAVDNARAVGFRNINLDLIYGLPGQTLSQWEHTLTAAGQVRPESVCTYRLRVHPKGTLAQFTQRDLPSAAATMLMYAMAVEHHETLGYLHAASHNFVSSADHIQRHVTEKQGIEHHELLGLGVSAYSVVNRHYYWNECSLERYRSSLAEHRLPIWRGTALTIDEELHKAMVLGLHEFGGINISQFRDRFGCSPLQVFPDTVGALRDLGLLQVDEERIGLTYAGMIYADEVCPHFYSQRVRDRIATKGLDRHGMGFVGDDQLQLI